LTEAYGNPDAVTDELVDCILKPVRPGTGVIINMVNEIVLMPTLRVHWGSMNESEEWTEKLNGVGLISTMRVSHRGA
jgi:hypothetical protein